MPKRNIDPADENAPSSPRLKNYYQFKGEHLTPEERKALFTGDPMYLRRIFELATQHTHPAAESEDESEHA